MQSILNHPFNIGQLQFKNRLVQGPLAGFSCAPFRSLYYDFLPPAYCVSEMISAHDVLYKHKPNSRYLYRAPRETILCYQLSGSDPIIMSQAAHQLESLGADLIDINAGCPKAKIRKKGAGSALLDSIHQLREIVANVKEAIHIPLTVKVRIQGDERDIILAQSLAEAGADALIIHGRRWVDDYSIPSDMVQIGLIKQAVNIPVIANGDIGDAKSLMHAVTISACDAYMISRAGTGKPWLYQQWLTEHQKQFQLTKEIQLHYFMKHLEALANLEDEYKAILQSKTLVRYYFRDWISEEQRLAFYALNHLSEIECFLKPLTMME